MSCFRGLRSVIHKWVTQKFPDSVTKINSLFDFKYTKRSTFESLRSELSYLGRVANVEISTVGRFRFKRRTHQLPVGEKSEERRLHSQVIQMPNLMHKLLLILNFDLNVLYILIMD